MIGRRTLGFLLGIGICLVTAAAQDAPSRPPVVKVTGPKGGGFLVHPGDDTKLLVSLEITDAGRVGIESDDMGTPKFYEPDDNVDAFRSHIIAKGTYTNSQGQPVIQLIAEIPSRDLKIEKDSHLSPPIDAQSLSEKDMNRAFMVPMEAMADLVTFHFRVQDRAGAISAADTEGTNLLVGLTPDLYRPVPADFLSDEDSKRILDKARKRS